MYCSGGLGKASLKLIGLIIALHLGKYKKQASSIMNPQAEMT